MVKIKCQNCRKTAVIGCLDCKIDLCLSCWAKHVHPDMRYNYKVGSMPRVKKTDLKPILEDPLEEED